MSTLPSLWVQFAVSYIVLGMGYPQSNNSVLPRALTEVCRTFSRGKMYKRANRSYDEGDDGEEEERAGDPGREESFSFAFAQHLPLLQHQVDEGEQHAVDHRLPRNASKHKFDPRRLENEMPLAKVPSVSRRRNVQICPASTWSPTRRRFRSIQRAWRRAKRRRRR